MLLIDFSHTSHRNLFISRGKSDDVNEYIPFYFHNMFQSIGYLKKKFKKKGEEVFLCIDSRSNWRKDVYPDYKGNRKVSRDKDKFDWNEFFKYQTELIQCFEENTRFHVIEVDKAEGDDILYVLSEHLSNIGEEVVVVTSDKDLKQISKFDNVQMFDPMKDKFITDYTERSLLNHILIGDKSDNIPSVMDQTEFSQEFISFLKGKNIYFEDVESVKKLEIFKEVEEEWLSDPVMNGLMYKPARFGPKTADKLILGGKLEETLENETIRENFERNKKLIDLSYIPTEIKESILEEFEYQTQERKQLKMFGLQNFFSKYRLNKLQSRISDFLT